MKKIRGIKIRRSTARLQLWSAFSLFIKLRDKRAHGDKCRIGAACRGTGMIECAYHIVPAQRGDATKYNEDNVIGACCRCNDGEHWHRSLYRDHHVRIFGPELIDRLESEARKTVQLSTAQLIELRDHYRARLAGE